jgi:hypothetical protein
MRGSDGSTLPSVEHAAVELARLREENARLRQALRVNGRYARRIRRAHDAALQMALWHIGYLETSRAACMGRGMAQRQWENGTALLRLARVIDRGGRWRLHDLPSIESALQRAADRAGETPEAYFARGNKHMRRRGHNDAAGLVTP